MSAKLKKVTTERLRANDAFFAAGRTIEELLPRVLYGGNDHLIPTVIANCGILVEGTLNDAYVTFFEMLKKREYHDPLDSLLRSPFHTKFRLLPLLLSEWQYQWNMKHAYVKKLFDLMSLRNRMLHAYHPTVETTVFQFDGFSTMPEHDEYPYYGRGTKGKIASLDVADCVDTAKHFNRRFDTLALNMRRKEFSRMEQSRVFIKFA